MLGTMSLEAQLTSLPDDRRAAVALWLAESIGDCVSCAQPVRRTDPHRIEKDGFAHLNCKATPTPATEEEPKSKAVAARARRSDWG